MLVLKHRDDVYSKGEVCNLVPGYPLRCKSRSNCRLLFWIKYQELCSSQVLEIILMDKYRIFRMPGNFSNMSSASHCGFLGTLYLHF